MIRTTGKTKTKAQILINFKNSYKNKGKFEKKSKGEIERKKSYIQKIEISSATSR